MDEKQSSSQPAPARPRASVANKYRLSHEAMFFGVDDSRTAIVVVGSLVLEL